MKFVIEDHEYDMEFESTRPGSDHDLLGFQCLTHTSTDEDGEKGNIPMLEPCKEVLLSKLVDMLGD